MNYALTALLPRRMREGWAASQRRIAALEKQEKETLMLLDLLLADAAHSEHCEVGMHAQSGRRDVVQELFRRFGLRQAVETGTFIGNTTNYLARTFGVPVFSSELIPRYHHMARRMLRNTPNVNLRLQDCRSFLRDLAGQSQMTSVPTFFYLDAHWYNDLPLSDELDIIAAAWKHYIVLIDDFAVPGDPGYAFDDYGPGKALIIDYLLPMMKKHGLRAYFPSIRASDESGGRPGYVVVAPDSCTSELGAMSLLREYRE